MKHTTIGIVALALTSIMLIGCSSAENLSNRKHGADSSLAVGSGSFNSERFVIDQPDGRKFSRTYEGNGDPMTVETTQEGLFSITGEGTVGGANIVFPSDNPAQPPTIIQMVGQNDLKGKNLRITMPNGAEAVADEFEISASATRQARAESLDRYVTMFNSLSETQRAAIQADRDRFIAAVEAVAPELGDAIRLLIPAP